MGEGGDAPVLEATGDILEVSHAAGSSGLSPLGLLSPLVCRCATTKKTVSTRPHCAIRLDPSPNRPIPPSTWNKTHRSGAWRRGIRRKHMSCAACGDSCDRNDGTDCASTRMAKSQHDFDGARGDSRDTDLRVTLSERRCSFLQTQNQASRRSQ